jgi:hypothetical protein
MKCRYMPENLISNVGGGGSTEEKLDEIDAEFERFPRKYLRRLRRRREFQASGFKFTLSYSVSIFILLFPV